MWMIASEVVVAALLIGGSLWASAHGARAELLVRDAVVLVAGGTMLLAGHQVNLKFWLVVALTALAAAWLVKDWSRRARPVTKRAV